MKITRISAQAKDKRRYSIYVDEQFAFGLSESMLLELGLYHGQEVSADELASFKLTVAHKKLYEQVMQLIMRRPRSEWEIRMYLKRKQIDPADAENIVHAIRDKGYIDDEDFARRWVENRRLLKATSRQKLRLELQQKRVASSIIDAVLISDETEESQVLTELVVNKRKQARYKDDQKLMQYLARQGFRYDDIKSALSGDTG